jgi:hypothetical protein
MGNDDKPPEQINNAQIAVLIEKMEQNEKDHGILFEMLKEVRDGIQGKNGLVTKQALTHASLKRAWWFIGIMIAGLMSTSFFIIRSSLS